MQHEYKCICTILYMYSDFHNDCLFLVKKEKYICTQRCGKTSNRCVSVTGPGLGFFFESKKKTIIMEIRVLYVYNINRCLYCVCSTSISLYVQYCICTISTDVYKKIFILCMKDKYISVWSRRHPLDMYTRIHSYTRITRTHTYTYYINIYTHILHIYVYIVCRSYICTCSTRHP